MSRESSLVTPDLLKRLFAKVTGVGTGGCWVWQGSANRGYGSIRSNGKKLYVHRASWIGDARELQDGMILCHKCDNPRCVNPSHMFVGTYADNTADMIAKGRRFRNVGELSGCAKLDAASVSAIRRDPRKHHVIASDYGVSRSTISMVKSGKNWSHV